jgi:hypothetical protein
MGQSRAETVTSEQVACTAGRDTDENTMMPRKTQPKGTRVTNALGSPFTVTDTDRGWDPGGSLVLVSAFLVWKLRTRIQGNEMAPAGLVPSETKERPGNVRSGDHASFPLRRPRHLRPPRRLRPRLHPHHRRHPSRHLQPLITQQERRVGCEKHINVPRAVL